MNSKLRALSIPENRFWGTLLLVGGYSVPAIILILWWKVLGREDKVKLLSCCLAWVLLSVLNIVPVLGQLASIAMLVFLIIGIVKFYKGDVDYKIIGAYHIANAIIKK